MAPTAVDEKNVEPFILLSGHVGLSGANDSAVGGIRQRRLLAGLTIRHDEIVTPDWLNDIVWYGEEPPDAAPATIRTYVYRLRKALNQDHHPVHLETVGGSYRLNCPPGTVDVEVFESHATGAELALESGNPDIALRECDHAFAVWNGDPYGEFSGEPWAAGEASRLNELHQMVEERHAAAQLGLGRVDGAIVELQRLRVYAPLRERRAELLVRALVRAGRQGDALQECADYRARLRDERGLEPSKAFAELEQQILTDDESLLRPPTLRTIRSFQLLEQISTDNMLSSWRARHPSLDHEVRLDSFPAAIADDARFVRNFEPWLRRLSRLEHPAIVAIDDYWREPGSAHVVTRLLRGSNLAAHLDSDDAPQPRFDDLVDQIGGALADAHRDGVFHGAITLDNIVSDHLGNWYLTGFANATAISGDAAPADDVDSLAQVLKRAATEVGEHSADAVLGQPGDNLSDFLAEIRRRSRPALRAPHFDADAKVSRNPYPGLRPFDDSERTTFFGREQLIERVVRELADDMRFSVIIGPSGTGKSSLLHAGILPALVETHPVDALVARLTPGSHPFERLASALRSISVSSNAHHIDESHLKARGLDPVAQFVLPVDTKLVVAVDQLEELFIHVADEAEQRRFLDMLLIAATEPGSPIRVIVTLRSDHFGALLSSHSLAETLQRSLVPVPPFSPGELERVITGPAHLAGIDVEARLVSALTAELSERPSLLPHLQHLLRQLFEQRDGNVLTKRAYDDMGGVTGSLGSTGELLYERLDDPERQALRRTFHRLSHIDSDGEVSRRRIALADLVGGADSEQVLDQLARERLVVFDHDPGSRAPTVEITHESIFRGWPRLATWLREDADVARLLEELSERSRTWLQLDREQGELLRGGRLDLALDAMPTIADELSEREHDFVEASVRARDEDLARDLRRRRRLRTSLVAALIGLVISAAAGLIALNERSHAERAAIEAQDNASAAELASAAATEQADLANAATRLADKRLLFASARLVQDENPRLGLLLSAQLYEQDPSFETLSLLQEALVDLPRGLEQYFGAAVPYTDVSLSADGTTLAGLTQTGVEVWDTDSGELRYTAPVEAARDIAVSSSALHVVDVGGSMMRTDLGNGSTTQLDAPFPVRALQVVDELIAVGGEGGRVAFSKAGGSWAELPLALPAPVDRIHVGADGRYAVATTETERRAAVIWDLEMGTLVGTHGHSGAHGIIHTIDAVVVGDQLASIGPDNSLQIRSLPDLSLRSSTQWVGRRLEPAGEQSLLAMGETGWLSLRDIDTGLELDRFVGTGSRDAGHISVSADGTSVALATRAGIELWSLSGGRALPDSFLLDGEFADYTHSISLRTSDGLSSVARADLTNPGLAIFKWGEPTTMWDQVGLPTAMSMQMVGDIGIVLLSDLSVRFVDIDGDRITLLPDLGLTGLSASDTWAFDRFEDTIAIVTGRTDSEIVIVKRSGDTLDIVHRIPFSGTVPGLGFSPDGTSLQALASGRDISVWHTDTWELAWQSSTLLDSRISGATSVDEDEGIVLTIDGDIHHVNLVDGSGWSVSSSTRLSTAGFPLHVFSQILESGHLLTVVPDDWGGAARLWDLEANAQVGVSFPAVGEGGSIHYENELRTGEGNVVHIWPVDVDTWPDHACRIAGRDLTDEEWATHGPTGATLAPLCS